MGKKMWVPDGRSKAARESPLVKAMLRKTKKKDGCFVSTVCFGDSSVETQIFRNWRDNYLLDRYWGVKFVSWYYNNGENLSKKIERIKILRVLASYLLSNFSHFLGKWYR